MLLPLVQLELFELETELIWNRLVFILVVIKLFLKNKWSINIYWVKCMVPNTSHVGKRLRESDHGYSLGCEVPLETE